MRQKKSNGGNVREDEYAGVRKRIGVNEVATRRAEVPPCELDVGAAEAVAAVAGRLGLGGEKFEDMAMTWMRPIVDEGYGATDRGVNRARAVVNCLGRMLGGQRFRTALDASGLTMSELTAFRFACPDLNRVFQVAKEAMKESMGLDVLDTAYDLATEGSEVLDRAGKVVGKKKSEKMLDRLLALSGREFQKGVSPDKGGGAGHGGAASGGLTLTFNFGGGNSQKVELEKAEAVDV